MARRSKSRKNNSQRSYGRANPHFANLRLPRRPQIPTRSQQLLATARYAGEDRRFFHPLGRTRPPRSVWGTVARVEYGNTPAPRSRSVNYFSSYFNLPQQTTVCVRRNQRKEVLHALKKTGRNTSYPRRKRRTYTSDVSCRTR